MWANVTINVKLEVTPCILQYNKSCQEKLMRQTETYKVWKERKKEKKEKKTITRHWKKEEGEKRKQSRDTDKSR